MGIIYNTGTQYKSAYLSFVLPYIYLCYVNLTNRNISKLSERSALLLYKVETALDQVYLSFRVIIHHVWSW